MAPSGHISLTSKISFRPLKNLATRPGIPAVIGPEEAITTSALIVTA